MAGALVGLAGIGSTASADDSTLYAAVNGNGTTCTSGSPCALTEALSSATSGDTVDLAPGTYQPGSDASFTISTSITMQSTTPGSTATLEGNGAGVLGVNSSVTAIVSGLSIEDGSAVTDGGGIANSGTLTVEASTISGNAAQYAGGGIANSGTLTVEDSTISGNNAGGGGGIYNSGTLTVEDSTIFGNTAIACLNGVDSTGQPCVAPLEGGGGGIYNQGTATIEASTVTGNSVATGYVGAFGGGINNSADSSVTLAADIIADQSSGGDCSNDAGTVTDAGYNIDDDGTCGLSVSNSSMPDSTVIDDYLGTLGPNGGPTETVPLLITPSSATSSADPAFAVIPSTFDLPNAVNGVSLACSIPDQRGVTPDQPCDIGAFSLAIDTVAFVTDGGETVASITGPDGSSITLPSDTYPGYNFNGWYAAASGGIEVAGAGASYVIPAGGVTLYAQWSPIATDDYSFNAAGGAPTPNSGSGLDGTTITLPGAPTQAGYAFGGWNDGTNTYGAGATYTLSSGGSPIVFTAQWGANATDDYSFNSAGGSPSPTAGSGLDGTTITLPTAPTRAGYTFAGWNSGTTTTTSSSAEMTSPEGYSASQMIFDDQFSGTSLDNNWSPQLGDEGSTWNNNGALPSPYSGPNTPLTNEEAMFGPSQVSVDNGLTLTATPNTNKYSGSYPWISGVVTTDGKFTLPTTGGWYVQVRAKMPDTSQGMWPAIWFLCGTKCSANNEFDGYEGGFNGSNPNEIMHSDYFANQGQQEEGYNVGTDLTSGYNTYGFQFIPSHSITAYLNGQQVWQVLASSGVTITGEPYEIILELQVASALTSGFHTVTNSSTPTSSMEVSEVQAYSYPPPSYYSAGASYTLSSAGSPIVFTAEWSANATDNYSFNAVGGAPSPSSGSGLDGTTITLPRAPTQPGYTFDGWSTGTTTYSAGATYTLSSGGSPIAFSAQWSANATDDYSFAAAGGAPTPTSGSGLDGTTITLPGAPTQPGYTFAGWNNGTSSYGAGATYTLSSAGSPVVFTAEWSANATDEYSFNAAGGAPSPSSGSGLDGTPITLPGAPTQPGYVFSGWNDGTTTYSAGATYSLSSGGTPIVFTAEWSANATDAYSFNAAGGTPTPSSGSGFDGATITLPGAPTQPGYTFSGWNNGTTTYSAGATYTLSSGGTAIVFTAEWSANATDAYSFNAAGGTPTPSSGSGFDGATITLPGAPDPARLHLQRMEQRHDHVQRRCHLQPLERGHGHRLHRPVERQCRGRLQLQRRGRRTHPQLRRRASTAPPSPCRARRRGPATPSVAGAAAPPPTAPAPPTRSRAGARPSSSRPSGAPTRRTPTASTRRAAHLPQVRAAASTAPPSPCRARPRDRLHLRRLEQRRHHLQRRRHLHALERGHGHRLHGPVERQPDGRLQLQRGGRRTDPKFGLGPRRHHHHPAGRARRGPATPSVAGTTARPPTGPAPPTRSRAAARPSSSPPSGPPTRTDAYSFNAAGGAPTPTVGQRPRRHHHHPAERPARAGYTFGGWNNGTTTYGAGATYTLSSGGTAIVFTAQWTANPTDAYSFNAAGGAPTPTSGSGLNGTTITLPSAPTRAGYTFGGWSNGTTTYSAGATYTLSSGGTAIVFTAQWTVNAPVAETTTTGLTLSKTSVTYGAESTDTFTVTVTGKAGDGYPEGTVTISNSSTTLCSAVLSETSSDSAAAICSLTVTQLSVGSYSDVVATYTPAASSSSSNASFAYTTSGSTPAKSLSVAKDTTTTTVSETPSSVVYGDESASIFSVTVTAHYGETVPSAEKVTVKVGTATCSVTLSAGKGTCTISNTALGAGTDAVSASYGGDTNLGASSASATKGLTVTKDSTTTTVSESPTTVTTGAESASVFSVTVTTHYGEAVPSAEKVTVKVGTATCTATLSTGKGTCTIAKSALGVGTYAVSASYGGDTNLSASSASSATELTVKKG